MGNWPNLGCRHWDRSTSLLRPSARLIRRLVRGSDEGGNKKYLVGLAEPTSFTIVGPAYREGCFSSLCHGRERGVFDLRRFGSILLDKHHNGPAAVGRVLQVFFDWVVAVLPAVQGAPAQETRRVVGVCVVRVKEESSIGELQ